MKKILITSALPYANGPLHFGHIAGAYLPGDCYARFQRMHGNDVRYFCGSDEYGVAITMSAELAGRTPKEHVDIFHETNKALFEQLNFSFDHYSRTTSSEHQAPVQEFFLDLLKNGYIEEKVSDHLYSEADEKFLADRYVVGTCPRCGYDNARGDECQHCGAAYDVEDLIDPRSKISNAPLVKRPTKHWFLLLDKFKDKLSAWIETKNWKPNVINFIKNYIDDLRPRAITRDSKWGIPIPLEDTEGKVLYVWFDAPVGYITSAMEWAKQLGQPDKWQDYWFDNDTKLVQFIGKDNIPFHSVIFPAMIMGQDKPYKLVDDLPANEFYNLEGRRFSKSEGWYIDLQDFFTKYTADQIRYTIAANAPENADSEFTWSDFQRRCNVDLLGKYGNFVNRTLVFAAKHCQSKVPDCQDLSPEDRKFLGNINATISLAADNYEQYSLRRASQAIMELAQQGNVYFDQQKPWQDAKDPERQQRLRNTISCCLECVKAMALISSPIMPDAAQKVWQMLGNTTSLAAQLWKDVASQPLPVGQPLPKPEILFSKVEDQQTADEIAKLKNNLAQAQQKQRSLKEELPPLKVEVDYEHFDQLDLRVGEIKEAHKVKKSKKLLQLKVDIGLEERTLVSGVSQHYDPQELIGKKVVVVANLKPAKIMGVTSHGMVLAGSLSGMLRIAKIDELPAGAKVS
ncbi:MAG: methionine--tRNA ligase [Chlamydiota bacterium]